MVSNGFKWFRVKKPPLPLLRKGGEFKSIPKGYQSDNKPATPPMIPIEGG